MSRERAVRRAERERAAAAERAARERRAGRRARRQAAARALRERVPRRTRWGRHQGLLARRRRVQNAVVLVLFLIAQVLVWLFTSDPWVRAAALAFGLLSLPVIVTLVFDRRS